MKNISFLIILILIGVLCFTCVEKIDLPSNQEFEDSIGVSAKLYFNDYNEATVEISAVNSKDGNRAFDDDFNFKQVFIENSLGQKWEIPSRSPGYYIATKSSNDSEFNLGFDLQYRLQLNLFNGQTIYSEFESVYGKNISSEVNYELQNEIGNISNVKTLVNIDPNSIDGNFRIFPVETYKFSELDDGNGFKSCYFRNELYLDNIVLVSTKDAASNLTNLVPYDRKLPDFLRAEGYFLEIISEGLSPGAFTYWSQVKKLLERTGNLFDEAPGVLSSNLYNETEGGTKSLGYFYVTVHKSQPRFFSTEDLYGGPPGRVCPIVNQVGDVNPACYDCSSLRGAMTAPPRYWPQ